MPILDKRTVIVMQIQSFKCENPECSRKTFSKGFDFVEPYAQRTARLDTRIMGISIGASSVKAAQTIKSEGIASISKSTVVKMPKKNKPEIDKLSIWAVCIDDFALKKGHNYGTILVDMETGMAVGLLGTRDTEAVAEWLKTFPNIKLVCRDGSKAYAAAISKAHPDAIQISDRHHLIQGFIDAAIKTMRAELPKEIILELDGEKASPEEPAEAKPETKAQENARIRAETKLAKAEKALEMRAEGISYKEIAKEAGLSAQTIKKYESEGYDPGKASGPPREIYEYWDEAESMHSDGKSASEMHKALKELGYKGSIWPIRAFIKEKAQQAPAAATKGKAIKRELIEQMLLKPISDIEGLSAEDFE